MQPLPDDLEIRPATLADMAEITAIYAPYTLTTTISFEVTPPSIEEMEARWEKVRAIGASYVVAVVGGQVAGYAYASAYRPRPAYARTVENSIYLAPGWIGRGLGRALLDRVIEDCRRAGFAQMIAVIAGSNNVASIRLHRSCGFAPAGVLRSVGHKFGAWLDTTLMQLAL